MSGAPCAAQLSVLMASRETKRAMRKDELLRPGLTFVLLAASSVLAFAAQTQPASWTTSKYHRMHGTVETVDSTAGTFTVKHGSDASTFKTDSATKFRHGTMAIALADVKSGDEVRVSFTESDADKTAVRVDVVRASTDPCKLDPELPQCYGVPAGPEHPFDMGALGKLAQKALTPGRFAFEPTREMRQGQPERVFVRVSPDLVSDISHGFAQHPEVSAIKVTPVMRSLLVARPEEFSVQAIGEDRKVLRAPFTEWAWYVTPLAAGSKNLQVLVYATLTLPPGDRQEPLEVFSKGAEIHVHVAPAFVIGRFVAANWQWLVGSPLIGALAWLFNRSRKRRPKAGFE
jgi:Cu/Ag efflux protein CusF